MDVSKITAAMPTAIPSSVRKLRIRCEVMACKAKRVESAMSMFIASIMPVSGLDVQRAAPASPQKQDPKTVRCLSPPILPTAADRLETSDKSCAVSLPPDNLALRPPPHQ